MREPDDDDDKGDVDMEKGDYPYQLYSTSSSTGLQQRRALGQGPVTRNRKVIADLEQMGVRTPATVARAVNAIDSWTFMTGTYVYYSVLLSTSLLDLF